MNENLPAKNGLNKLENQPMTLAAYAADLKSKMEMCSIMLKSGMVPTRYKTPESVLVAILMGGELGFSPLSSLRLINVIQGQASVSAAGLKAKAMQSGVQFFDKEWNEKKCIIVAKRKGWDKEIEVCYSIEDAQKAGLAGKDNWVRMPKPMLYARCVSTACRNIAADVIEGLYSTEEILDEAGETFSYNKAGEVVREGPAIPASMIKTVEIADNLPANIAQDEPQGIEYIYDIDNADPDIKTKAIAVLKHAKARLDGKTGYYLSKTQLKKLERFEIGHTEPAENNSTNA